MGGGFSIYGLSYDSEKTINGHHGKRLSNIRLAVCSLLCHLETGENMKRKCIGLFLMILMFLCALAPAFSAGQEAGSVNYFADCVDNKEYAALLKHVFDDQGLNGALNAYATLVAAIPYYSYEPWVQDLMLARASLIVAKYANELDNEPVAVAYMENADSLIVQSKVHGAPESASGVVEALSNSFWYLVEGSISKGMAFGRIVGDLWESHPEDFHVMLLTADKFLHSPGIVGGNKRKGLELYQEAEKIAEKNGCAIWDQFSIYAGLAVGYDKNKNDAEAQRYAQLAYSIYTADSNVNEILGID